MAYGRAIYPILRVGCFYLRMRIQLYTMLALDQEVVIEYSLIGSAAFGEKRISLTVPLCPGSLYSNFLVPASHTATLPSPPPAPILSPTGDQLALMRFFSIPDGAPSYLCSR